MANIAVSLSLEGADGTKLAIYPRNKQGGKWVYTVKNSAGEVVGGPEESDSLRSGQFPLPEGSYTGFASRNSDSGEMLVGSEVSRRFTLDESGTGNEIAIPNNLVVEVVHLPA